MDTRRILAELRTERDRINQAIAAIEAINVDGTKPSRQSPATTTRRRRRMSAAARRKLSAMMKARWAERKKKAKA